MRSIYVLGGGRPVRLLSWTTTARIGTSSSEALACAASASFTAARRLKRGAARVSSDAHCPVGEQPDKSLFTKESLLLPAALFRGCYAGQPTSQAPRTGSWRRPAVGAGLQAERYSSCAEITRSSSLPPARSRWHKGWIEHSAFSIDLDSLGFFSIELADEFKRCLHFPFSGTMNSLFPKVLSHFYRRETS